MDRLYINQWERLFVKHGPSGKPVSVSEKSDVYPHRIGKRGQGMMLFRMAFVTFFLTVQARPSFDRDGLHFLGSTGGTTYVRSWLDSWPKKGQAACVKRKECIHHGWIGNREVCMPDVHRPGIGGFREKGTCMCPDRIRRAPGRGYDDSFPVRVPA